MTRAELAELAAELLETNGGFTLDSDGQSPSEGYAVAIYPDAEEIVTDATPGRIREYITKWSDVLARDARAHLGGWVDAGRVYLDLSAVIPDLADALRIGREFAQIAIFDLATFTEIRLD